MSKPKLNESAVIGELGAVATFANTQAMAPDVQGFSAEAANQIPEDATLQYAIDGAFVSPEAFGDTTSGEELSHPLPSETASSERPSGSTDAPPPIPTYARTGARRAITRYSFEFYQDQIAVLKHLSLEEKVLGGKGSMSEMVREAIDDYLAKRNENERI